MERKDVELFMTIVKLQEFLDTFTKYLDDHQELFEKLFSFIDSYGTE